MFMDGFKILSKSDSSLNFKYEHGLWLDIYNSPFYFLSAAGEW